MMFEYIKGILTEASPLRATVETGGLGYAILIPVNNYAALPQIGREVVLYLSLVIREDSQRLYGFLTRNEKELFEKLIEVSGIGPKTALSLIGNMEINDLQLAITTSDIPLICKIPGIGKKTAERLIIEMKDKIKNFIPLSAAPHTPSSDAINALVHLGYHHLQAQKAVKAAVANTQENLDLSSLITAALRCL